MAKKDKSQPKEIKVKGFFIQGRSKFLNGIVSYCSMFKKRQYSNWSNWVVINPQPYKTFEEAQLKIDEVVNGRVKETTPGRIIEYKITEIK